MAEAEVARERTATFTREEDGSVTIAISSDRAFVLSPEEWCQAIASVTPLGVSPRALIDARRFHGYES